MAVFHRLQSQAMGVLRSTARFPTFQMYSSSLLLHGSNRNPASVIKINQYNNTLLCQLVHWYEEPKVFMWQSQLLHEWTTACACGGSIPDLELRTLHHQSPTRRG